MQYTSYQRIISIFLVALICFVFLTGLLLITATPAYCDATVDKFVTATDTIAEKIYKIFRAIVCPLCIVALMIAAYQFIAGGNRGAEMAGKIVKACVIAIFLVAFAPTLIQFVAQTIKDSVGSDDNPLHDA